MTTLRYLEKINETSTIEELWTMHLEKMATYGFDRIIYGYTRFRSGDSTGNPNDSLILTNHTKEYIDGYIYSGLYYHAPALRWSLNNTGACSWSWIADDVRKKPLTSNEQKVVDFNFSHNVTAGYSISFKTDSSRNMGGISMTAKLGVSQSDLDEMWAHRGREILMINNVVHLKILSLPYSNSQRALTRRQREALEWVGEGKTMQDIATIMELTSATVEKHLRLAREVLDVDTTAQAVLKASFQKQIFVLEA